MKNQNLITYKKLLDTGVIPSAYNGLPLPQSYGFQTLWIPNMSGNRTAVYNLNHGTITVNDDDTATGWNGNCSTPYCVLEVPAHWGENELDALAINVCNAMSRPLTYYGNCPLRVLKADTRLSVIRKCIEAMTEGVVV